MCSGLCLEHAESAATGKSWRWPYFQLVSADPEVDLSGSSSMSLWTKTSPLTPRGLAREAWFVDVRVYGPDPCRATGVTTEPRGLDQDTGPLVWISSTRSSRWPSLRSGSFACGGHPQFVVGSSTSRAKRQAPGPVLQEDARATAAPDGGRPARWERLVRRAFQHADLTPRQWRQSLRLDLRPKKTARVTEERARCPHPCRDQRHGGIDMGSTRTARSAAYA